MKENEVEKKWCDCGLYENLSFEDINIVSLTFITEFITIGFVYTPLFLC